MLIPRKVKHRKWHKGRGRGVRGETRGTSLEFGAFGLLALSPAWVSSRQIEAARRVMLPFVARGGKIWIRIFPDKPITARSPETPMGGGKGDVEFFVAVVKPGRILFELDGIASSEAREAFRLAGSKLPLKTRIITKAQT